MTLTYDPSTTSTDGAIVASPLPFLGGDMDNNVVRTLARSIARQAMPVLRYDYRSVGASRDVMPSEARYETWRRVEETGDRSAVIADADEALRRARGLFRPTLLAGYSFGCWTAAHCATVLDDTVPMILVAPPLAHVDIASVASHGAPVLLVFADDDVLSPTPPRADLRETFPAARVAIFKGADHFFRDREDDLAATVEAFLQDAVEHSPRLALGAGA